MIEVGSTLSLKDRFKNLNQFRKQVSSLKEIILVFLLSVLISGILLTALYMRLKPNYGHDFFIFIGQYDGIGLNFIYLTPILILVLSIMLSFIGTFLAWHTKVTFQDYKMIETRFFDNGFLKFLNSKRDIPYSDIVKVLFSEGRNIVFVYKKEGIFRFKDLRLLMRDPEEIRDIFKLLKMKIPNVDEIAFKSSASSVTQMNIKDLYTTEEAVR